MLNAVRSRVCHRSLLALAALVAALLGSAACSAPGTVPLDGLIPLPDTGGPVDVVPDLRRDGSPDDTVQPGDGGPTDASDASPGDGGPGDGGPADLPVLFDVPSDQPLSPPLVTIELPAVTSGQVVRFTLPEGTLGFQLVARGRSGSELGIQSVTGPSSGSGPALVLVDQYTVAGWPFASLVGYEGIVSAQLPSSDVPDTLPLPAGEWEVILTGEDLAGTVHVQATSDGQFHGGVLDLHLYIPDGLVVSDPHPQHALTVEDRFSDDCILTRIESFFSALGELYELEQGQVYLHGLPADQVSATDDASVAARFAGSLITGDPRGAHIILQNGVDVQGSTVWGVSPGAPGNGLSPGQPNSALLLNVLPDFGARADGYTLVHELGHFIGLLHSSELDGVNSDPLSDTPACGSMAATNPRACPDGHNIMFAIFWGASGGQDIITSARQRQVMQGSPLYRRLP